jgi:hypothetical protein
MRRQRGRVADATRREVSRTCVVLIEALSRQSTVTMSKDGRDCSKSRRCRRRHFRNYCRISALLTRESVYNNRVSRFAALHGEENYSGQGCKEISFEKVVGEESAGEEEVRCQEGSGEEEVRCQKGFQEEGAGQEEVDRNGAGLDRRRCIFASSLRLAVAAARRAKAPRQAPNARRFRYVLCRGLNGRRRFCFLKTTSVLCPP